MSHHRPTPFELVFQHAGERIFPRVRTALAEGGHDSRDRDRFLMIREVVTLLRELRPDEGLGEGIDQLAALVHQAYLFWDAGEHRIEIPAEELMDLLTVAPPNTGADAPAAYYAQFPERRIWAEVIPGRPPEPLDGCFVHISSDKAFLRVLAVFGVHHDREGFSVVEASGRRPGALARKDSSPLFAPVLAGGAAAGLFSLIGEEELLELGWRVQLRAWKLGAGSWELGADSNPALVPTSQLPAPSS